MIEKLAELLNVAKITDEYRDHPDLQISEWLTADGYDVHVMTNDPQNLHFEYDVFYYQPDFDSIVERIQELNDSQAIVYVSDIETYLPEYEVENYIETYEAK
jgi:protein-tyrosine phosphatase